MENKLGEIINIKKINGALVEDGYITVVEESTGLPFAIKRVYTIFCDNFDVVRGRHAHYKLNQIIVCVSGSCKIKLDNGTILEEYNLDSPTNGLIVKDMIWREITNFSKNCIIVVLASEAYDENDYIRNYEEFLRITKNAKK